MKSIASRRTIAVLAMPALGVSLACGLAGCAFGDGDPYAVAAIDLRGQYVPLKDRDRPDGFQRLSNDYEIRVERMRWDVSRVELVAEGGEHGETGATGSFDPANPPEGYGLCHNGHCHSEDGRLVPYEEIAAEAGQTTTESVTALSLPVGAVDFLRSGSVDIACDPSCALEEGHLEAVHLWVQSVRIEATVRDTRATERIDGEVSFAATLDLAADATTLGRFDASLHEAVGDDEPAGLEVSLALAVDARVFDGIDFAATGATLTEGDPEDDEARAQLTSALAELPLQTQTKRNDP